MANTAQLILRVPAEEKSAWKAAAQAAQLSLTQWVRLKCAPAKEEVAPEAVEAEDMPPESQDLVQRAGPRMFFLGGGH